MKSVHGDVALQLQSNWNPVPFPRLSVAVGALHVLVVWISVLLLLSLGCAGSREHWHISLSVEMSDWHVCLWCHTASFPEVFILQGHSDCSDIYIPHSVLVIPDSFLLSELIPLDLLTQWGLRAVVFLFTVNIVQHFQVILIGSTIVSSLDDFQIFQNSEIRMLTTDLTSTQKAMSGFYMPKQH